MSNSSRMHLYDELQSVHDRLEKLLHRYRVIRRQLGKKRQFGYPKQKSIDQLTRDLDAISYEIGEKKEKKKKILEEIKL